MSESFFEDPDFRKLDEEKQLSFALEREPDLGKVSRESALGFIRERTGGAPAGSRQRGGLLTALGRTSELSRPSAEQAVDFSRMGDDFRRLEEATDTGIPLIGSPVRGLRQIGEGGQNFLRGFSRGANVVTYDLPRHALGTINRLVGEDPRLQGLEDRLRGLKERADVSTEMAVGPSSESFAGGVAEALGGATAQIMGAVGPAVAIAGPMLGFGGLAALESAGERRPWTEVAAETLVGMGMGGIMHGLNKALPRGKRMVALGLLFGEAAKLRGADWKTALQEFFVGGILGVQGAKDPRPRALIIERELEAGVERQVPKIEGALKEILEAADSPDREIIEQSFKDDAAPGRAVQGALERATDAWRAKGGKLDLRPPETSDFTDPRGMLTDRFEVTETAEGKLQYEPVSAGEKPAETTALAGRETRIPIVGGRELPARYEVVEAETLRTSHRFDNFQRIKEYAGGERGAQERDYRDPSEQLATQRLADTFDARQVYTDAPGPTDGPPMVLRGQDVAGGNKRTMAMQRIYAGMARTTPQELRAQTIDAAQRFGIEGADKLKQPIVIRRLGHTGLSRPELSKVLNEGQAQAVDVTGRAVALADSISEETLRTFEQRMEDLGTEDPTINRAIDKDRGIVKSLENDQIITAQNRNVLVDSNTGYLSEQGKRLVHEMMVAKVLPDAELLKSLPGDMKQKITRSTPSILASARNTPELLQTLRDVAWSEVRRQGTKDPDKFFTQDVLPGMDAAPSQLDPVLEAIHKTFLDWTQTEIRHGFRRFASKAKHIDETTPDLFGEGATIEDAWREFFNKSAGAKPVVAKREKSNRLGTVEPGATSPESTEPAPRKLGSEILPAIPERIAENYREKRPFAELPSEARLPRRLQRRGDILWSLGRALEIPFWQGIPKGRVKGKEGETVLGYYVMGRGTLKLKTWGDIETAAHEVMHYLQDVYPQVLELSKLPRELQGVELTFEEIARVSPEIAELARLSYPGAAKSVFEGNAEYLRHWLTDKTYAKEVAPRNYERWENEILPSLPSKAEKGLRRAQKEMHEYFGRGAQHALAERIGKPGANAQGVLNGFWDKNRQTNIDDSYGVELAERLVKGEIEPDGVTESFRRLRGIPAMSEGLLRKGAPRWIGEAGEIKFDAGPSIFKIMEPRLISSSSKRIDRFLRWAVARQARELMRQGRENLLDQRTLKAGESLLDAKHKEVYLKAFDGLKEFQSHVADFAMEAGLFNQKQRDRWNRQDYAFAFFREMGDSARTFAGQGDALGGASGINTLRGSSRNLRDPMDSIIRGPSRLMQLALENRVRLKLVDEVGNQPGGGKLMERIDPQSKEARIPTEAVMEKIADYLKDLGVDPEEMTLFKELATLEGMPEIMNLYTVGEKPFGDRVMTVLRNGKPEYWRLGDPLLVSAMKAMRRPGHTGALKWIAAVTRFERNIITMTPGFLYANMVRDPIMASVTTGTGFQHITAAMRGLKSSLLKDEHFWDFYASGGGGSMVRNDPVSTRRQLVRHSRRVGLDPRGLIVTPMDMFRMLETLGHAIETGSRVGEMRRAVEQGATKTHGAYMGREVTSDFGRRGDGTAVNALIAYAPFFGAMIQGNDRLYRALGKEGLSRSAQVGAKIGLLSLASLALVHENSGQAWYDDQPDHVKNAYWLFKPSWSPIIYHIPKIWEVGAWVSVIERAYESAVGSGDKLWLQAAEIVSSQWKVSPYGFATPLHDVVTNRVWFTDAPIETTGMGSVQPWDRSRAQTPDIFKKFGELQFDLDVPVRYQVSPVKAQAFLRGIFNTFATMGYRFSDAILDPQGAASHLDESDPFRRMFRRVGKSKRARSEFFDIAQEAEAVWRTYLSRLKKGDDARAEKLLRDPALIHYKRLQKAKRSLGGYRAERDDVATDPSLTPIQKRDQMDAIQAEMDALMKEHVELSK